MIEHSMRQFCQAIFSIQSQMKHVRDAIEQEKTRFYDVDLIFLQGVEICMTGYLIAVQGPLDAAIQRLEPEHRDMSTDPHPWGETGC